MADHGQEQLYQWRTAPFHPRSHHVGVRSYWSGAALVTAPTFVLLAYPALNGPFYEYLARLSTTRLSPKRVVFLPAVKPWTPVTASSTTTIDYLLKNWKRSVSAERRMSGKQSAGLPS